VSALGVVVIGRNEGQRLVVCLRSLLGRGHPVVYVDSGSTDGSVDQARALGAAVVELDLSIPFTAARARNAGARHLLAREPALRYIQFVDGDCEMIDGWLDGAMRELEANPRWAAVCGRLHERNRDRSIYSRLADLEWDAPPGDAKHCGGIAMYRADAWQSVGGFDPSLIAGEEPELCLRLRRSGWTLHRLAIDMAWHDIAITRFGQWWRRAVRSGFVYAQGAAMYGAGPERYCVRETLSYLAWGLVLPVVAFGLAWPTGGISLALLLAYPLLAWRIRRRHLRRGLSPAHAGLYGAACVLGKFAQVLGFFRYWTCRLLGISGRLIEYKASPAAGSSAATSSVTTDSSPTVQRASSPSTMEVR
jgi:GT2 family glycosyltransferase